MSSKTNSTPSTRAVDQSDQLTVTDVPEDRSLFYARVTAWLNEELAEMASATSEAEFLDALLDLRGITTLALIATDRPAMTEALSAFVDAQLSRGRSLSPVHMMQDVRDARRRAARSTRGRSLETARDVIESKFTKRDAKSERDSDDVDRS